MKIPQKLKSMRMLLSLSLLLLQGLTVLAAASSSAECSAADVLWLWSGALSSHSVSFRLGLREGHACGDRAFLLRADPELQPGERPHSAIAMCHVTGAPTVKACDMLETLHAGRTYRYELSLIQDDVIVKQGNFRTPSEEGKPLNFRVAFSSCADEDSDPQVCVYICIPCVYLS